MKIFLKIVFCITVLLSFSFCSPSSSTSSNASVSQNTPRRVVQQWLGALQKRNADVLLELLDKGSWDQLERNFKLYLQTLQNISDKPDPQITKMLSLNKKPFLKAFLNWENKVLQSDDGNYTISEVQTGQTTASATILGIENGKAYKIYLVKREENWFVRAEYLENLSPQQNQVVSEKTSTKTKSTTKP